MRRQLLSPKPAWEDRFRHPSAGDLLGGLNKQQGNLVEFARSRFGDLQSVAEQIDWLGIPWRWSFTYWPAGSERRAVGYIVPQPGKPLVALPLEEDLLAAIPPKRLSKFVRDGLVAAAQVGRVRWAQWEVTSRPQVEELVGIVSLRLRTQPAAASA